MRQSKMNLMNVFPLTNHENTTNNSNTNNGTHTEETEKKTILIHSILKTDSNSKTNSTYQVEVVSRKRILTLDEDDSETSNNLQDQHNGRSSKRRRNNLNYDENGELRKVQFEEGKVNYTEPTMKLYEIALAKDKREHDLSEEEIKKEEEEIKTEYDEAVKLNTSLNNISDITDFKLLKKTSALDSEELKEKLEIAKEKALIKEQKQKEKKQHLKEMESTNDVKKVITTSNDKNNELVVENNSSIKPVKKIFPSKNKTQTLDEKIDQPLNDSPEEPVIEKTKQRNTEKADTELNTEKVEKQPEVSKKKIPRAKKEVQIPLRKSSRLRNKQTD
ncbi:hypothetical protein HANVADRAFT_105972 [Hanseniaspora valbyensis NRRL Y-1626]|uniref:Uncharacterized protein n=1 Tax=Hanseniaspora valbyensis NRRL Y-1626 TaxID=766949 RepID=A0A1B7T7F4_9ASCO|nr:hypothetical protein HANVADRAFT_105972 [Hanseniaspora valbyensis NRRL Y-1626]